MSNIEWGPPIAVGGKRPEWLRDDDLINGCLSYSYEWQIAKCKWRNFKMLSAIRLPANHPYYNRTEQSSDIVTIARMTEADAGRLWGYTDGKARTFIDRLRNLGLIKPDPTPAERIASETGVALADVEKVLAAQMREKEPS